MAVETQAEVLAPPRMTPKRLPLARSLILTLSRVWSWIFLGLVVAYFSVALSTDFPFLTVDMHFFTLRNSQNILINIVPIMLMGLGQTFIIISGGIDLSVGWVMGLSSVMSALTMADLARADRPEPFAALFEHAEKLGVSTDASAIIVGLFVAVGVACIAGLANGIIIAKLHVPPFIVTLGVSFVARGIAWIKSEGNVVGGQPEGLRKVGSDALLYCVGCAPREDDNFWELFRRVVRGEWHFLTKPDLTGAQLRILDPVLRWPVVIMLVLTLIGIFLLTKTQFGRHTYAIGGNREAAIRAGVPVDRHTIMLYVLSAFTAGVGGFLYNARFMGGSAIAGEALMLMSIAAVFIGGVSLFGGEGRVTGTIIGSLILAVLATGLIIKNVQTFYQYIVVGIVVIIAVLIDQARDLVLGRAEGE